MATGFIDNWLEKHGDPKIEQMVKEQLIKEITDDMEKENIGILVMADDWEGLYVNGKLISEDHSLDNPKEWVLWTNIYKLTDVKQIELPQDKKEELELMEYLV